MKSRNRRCRRGRGRRGRGRRLLVGTRQARRSRAVRAVSAAAPGEAKKERKLLYYRNPMGLPDTSPVPKKDSMGMDYIAVYEGEEPAAAGAGLKISHRPLAEARRAHAARGIARPRPRREGRRPRRGRRAAPRDDRAEVRGLRRAAARERHRAARREGPAALRGLQPRARLRAARVRDRGARHEVPEGRGRRKPVRHGAARGIEPHEAAQLGRLRRADRGAREDRARPSAPSRSAPRRRASSWRRRPSPACASCPARCSTRWPIFPASG